MAEEGPLTTVPGLEMQSTYNTHIYASPEGERKEALTTTSLDEDYWMQWVSDAHLETPTELSDPCSSRPNPAQKLKRQNL